MPPPVGLKRDQTRPQAQLDAEGDPVLSYEIKGKLHTYADITNYLSVGGSPGIFKLSCLDSDY